MTLTRVVNKWRSAWARQRTKHGLGPSEDKDWNDYVNSITRAEFLENLLLWESILIDEDSNELG